jgi:hypothetical protein
MTRSYKATWPPNVSRRWADTAVSGCWRRRSLSHNPWPLVTRWPSASCPMLPLTLLCTSISPSERGKDSSSARVQSPRVSQPMAALLDLRAALLERAWDTFMGSTDPATLQELLRCMAFLVPHQSITSVSARLNSPEVIQKLVFMLRSSLDSGLLAQVIASFWQHYRSLLS